MLKTLKTSRRYEPEIDGLRALAVLVVLFFHAGINGFKGGFVGVDVFFVISGYLITRNILSDIAAGTFSYTQFYTHRARRIFPAMFFTMAVSAIAANLIFSPLDLERFGTSLLYSCIAIQNMLFWTEAGYWDVSKDVKPLLHFWSLGVEEQFYFFWPLLLLSLYPLLSRRSDRHFFAAILLISAVSFVAAQCFLSVDATAVFYLTPFRVFEFGIGALIITADPYFNRMKNPLKEVCLLCGIAAVYYPVRRYSENMPFPGFEALLPCLGGAIIIGARDARYAGVLLRNRLAVGIGRISYSLYLVHWPLFVFHRYYHLGNLDHTAGVVLAGISIILAIAMYRFVERPFRKMQSGAPLLTTPAFFTTMFLLLSSLAASAAYIQSQAGWSRNESRDLAIITENVAQAEKNRAKYLNGCVTATFGPCKRSGAKTHYVLLGDSFGEDVGIAFYTAFPESEFTLITEGGCKPLLETNSEEDSSRPACVRFSKKLFSQQADWSRYDGLVLSLAWNGEDITKLGPTITFLRAHGAKHIVVAGPKVTLGARTSQILGRSKTLQDYKSISQTEMDFSEQGKLQAAIEATTKSSRAYFLDIAKAECPDRNCPNLVPGSLMPLIWDKGHWTIDGSRYVGKNLKSYFRL